MNTKRLRIKVIARTSADDVYVVRHGKREYLELVERIPEYAFPSRFDEDIPYSTNKAYVGGEVVS